MGLRALVRVSSFASELQLLDASGVSVAPTQRPDAENNSLRFRVYVLLLGFSKVQGS